MPTFELMAPVKWFTLTQHQKIKLMPGASHQKHSIHKLHLIQVITSKVCVTNGSVIDI